jgi:hypothetical protein
MMDSGTHPQMINNTDLKKVKGQSDAAFTAS